MASEIAKFVVLDLLRGTGGASWYTVSTQLRSHKMWPSPEETAYSEGLLALKELEKSGHLFLDTPEGLPLFNLTSEGKDLHSSLSLKLKGNDSCQDS